MSDEINLQRYFENHVMLTGRLEWLWGRFLEYEGTGKRLIINLENFAFQTRLACEQYALMLQAGSAYLLPGSKKAKQKKYNAIDILNEVERHGPNVRLVALRELHQSEGNEPTGFTLNPDWQVRRELLDPVYQRCGNFLHVTNKGIDQKDFELLLTNAVNLVAQLILVTWHHVFLLEGPAEHIVSMMLPDRRHRWFHVRAADHDYDRVRAVIVPRYSSPRA